MNDLDNTIVINDLIRRYKIRKESLFKSLVNYVLRSNSRIFSANSIRDYILENIVYNELVYMGYKVWVYNNAGKEIDFLAQNENKKYYIQVAYSVAEDKAYSREFDAFKNLDNLSQKIIITNDDIDYSTSSVRHIKLKDFLVMTSL